MSWRTSSLILSNSESLYYLGTWVLALARDEAARGSVIFSGLEYGAPTVLYDLADPHSITLT